MRKTLLTIFATLATMVILSSSPVLAKSASRLQPQIGSCSSPDAIQTYKSVVWHPQQQVPNIEANNFLFSNQIRGTIWEKGIYDNGLFVGCGQYYANVTGTDPDPTVSCSTPAYSGCDANSDVAIWIYNGGHQYLASTPVYVANNSTATSGYTNTVSSTNGMFFVLGWRPNLNEPYCWAGSGAPLVANNICTGYY